MGGYHSGDMVLYRQPGEAPNMLCMNNIRLKFHNSLLNRRVKRRQILRELFAAQVGKGGRASGMGGEARKIKGQILLFRSPFCTLRGKHNRNKPHSGNICRRRIFWEYRAYFMPLFCQMRRDIFCICAAARALQREMVHHQNFHRSNHLSIKSSQARFALVYCTTISGRQASAAC